MAIQTVNASDTLNAGRTKWNANDAELKTDLTTLEQAVGALPVPMNPPAFFVTRTGAGLLRLSAGVATKVPFNTQWYDPHGRWDAANNQFVCPIVTDETEDGKDLWIVYGKFRLNDMGGGMTYNAHVFSNGVVVPGGVTQFRAATGNSGMTMDVLAPVWKWNNQTAALTIYCSPEAAVDLDTNNGLFMAWRVR